MSAINTSCNTQVAKEYIRAARVFRALFDDWQEQPADNLNADWWCHTGLFNLLIPDSLIVVGRSVESQKPGVRKRMEHLVPRLALCERIFAMYSNGATLSEVADFIKNYLKIVIVSQNEAKKIDRKELEQKTNMPIGNWWTFPDKIYIRLERAGIQIIGLSPDSETAPSTSTFHI